MPKCVLDTSICVDLWNAGILELTLRLPFDFYLPDVIAEECQEPAGAELIALGVIRVTLEGENIEVIITLRNNYPKCSVGDLFALTYARVHTQVLLTGDGKLRTAALAEGVEVHGIIWLLEALIAGKILSPIDAADSLEKMRAKGSWLPKRECDEFIKRCRE
jgi:predicted nucleic acid-binding protein